MSGASVPRVAGGSERRRDRVASRHLAREDRAGSALASAQRPGRTAPSLAGPDSPGLGLVRRLEQCRRSGVLSGPSAVSVRDCRLPPGSECAGHRGSPGRGGGRADRANPRAYRRAIAHDHRTKPNVRTCAYLCSDSSATTPSDGGADSSAGATHDCPTSPDGNPGATHADSEPPPGCHSHGCDRDPTHRDRGCSNPSGHIGERLRCRADRCRHAASNASHGADWRNGRGRLLDPGGARIGSAILPNQTPLRRADAEERLSLDRPALC
jgi:hypothetical protein